MRKRLRIAAGAVGMGLLLLAAPAGAQEEPEEPEEPESCLLVRGEDTVEDETDDLEVCRLDTWFTATTPPLANVAAAQGTLPSWDTTAPEASYQTGAGGAYVTAGPGSVAFPGDQKYEASFAGTFTGPMDNFAAEMFIASPVYQAAGLGFAMNFQLSIDDQVAVPFGTEHDVFISAVNDQYGKIRFAVTDLVALMELLELDLSPEAEHTVEIQLVNWYYGDGNSAILFDATEFPSALVFNMEPNKLGAYYKIDAA